MTNSEYSFDTTLVERERLVKELWKTYNQIISSIPQPWRPFMEEQFKPKAIPIQRVVRAPIYKSYKYTPRISIRYFVTDPSGTEIKEAYLLTPPKTLY